MGIPASRLYTWAETEEVEPFYMHDTGCTRHSHPGVECLAVSGSVFARLNGALRPRNEVSASNPATRAEIRERTRKRAIGSAFSPHHHHHPSVARLYVSDNSTVARLHLYGNNQSRTRKPPTNGQQMEHMLEERGRGSGLPRRLLATWWIDAVDSRVTDNQEGTIRHLYPPSPHRPSSYPHTPRVIGVMHRRCSSRNCWRMPTSHEVTASEVQDAGVHGYTRHSTRVAAHPGVRNTREWVPHSSATLRCHSSAGVRLRAASDPPRECECTRVGTLAQVYIACCQYYDNHASLEVLGSLWPPTRLVVASGAAIKVTRRASAKLDPLNATFEATAADKGDLDYHHHPTRSRCAQHSQWLTSAHILRDPASSNDDNERP
ncbi:hypothetical protein BDZ89DRAFT_1053683 [Hymenopellis radicata]|nr:hypothetical protein BDZ89DRAFT_1053683 [Hymenopellis radicata]